MAENCIGPIFKQIYGRDFDGGLFRDRLLMQKAIYLLEQFGVNVNNYGFYWYKHGPYSQSLQDDILSHPVSDDAITFTPYASDCMNLIARFASEPHDGYTDQDWMECIASIHYITMNLSPAGATFDEINDILKREKPHLSNDDNNRHAFNLLYPNN